jgi:hypothetical protein
VPDRRPEKHRLTLVFSGIFTNGIHPNGQKFGKYQPFEPAAQLKFCNRPIFKEALIKSNGMKQTTEKREIYTELRSISVVSIRCGYAGVSVTFSQGVTDTFFSPGSLGEGGRGESPECQQLR